MALLKLWKMRRLRISAISYLNTAPLMWDFEHGGTDPLAENAKGWDTQFEISYTLPSACARSLADGTADIGIIPAAAYTEIPGLQVLPEVAIASRRAVRSILLVSNVPDGEGSYRRAGYFFHDVGGADEGSVREVAGRRKNVHGDGAEC